MHITPPSAVGYDPAPLPAAIEEPASMAPRPKVVAAALAGATTSIILWLMGTFAQLDVPAEIGAAITTVVSFLISYITSDH
jgi:hypothetical protein